MRKKKSPILEAVHETARGLYEVGAIDKVTMRKYDQLCLQPVEPLAPEQIKQIREEANVSQAVFAAVLNTSTSTVQKWEIGAK
jgi:putative transcriptional regulator